MQEELDNCLPVLTITGPMGSGKSMVGDMFSKLGAFTLDCDKIVADLLENDEGIKYALCSIYGEQLRIFDVNGQDRINKPLLSQLMFIDKQVSEDVLYSRRMETEKLIHPVVLGRVQSQLRTSSRQWFEMNEDFNHPYVVLQVPVLLHSPSQAGFLNISDRILLIWTDWQLAMERCTQRRGTSVEMFTAIRASQADYNSLRKVADDVLRNAEDLLVLQKKVEKLHELYLQIFEIQ